MEAHEIRIRFPDNAEVPWPALEAKFIQYGRGKLYAASEKVMKSIPPDEWMAICDWAARHPDPLSQTFGHYCTADMVSAALIHAADKGLGRDPFMVAEHILERKPHPSIQGVILA